MIFMPICFAKIEITDVDVVCMFFSFIFALFFHFDFQLAVVDGFFGQCRACSLGLSLSWRA